MVEAMVALVLVDHIMMQKAQCELFPFDEESTTNDGDNSRPNPMGTTARRAGGYVGSAGSGGGGSDLPEEDRAAPSPVSVRVDEE